MTLQDFVNAGNAAFEQQDYRAAREWFEKALPLSGDNQPHILSKIARCSFYAGDLEDTKVTSLNALQKGNLTAADFLELSALQCISTYVTSDAGVAKETYRLLKPNIEKILRGPSSPATFMELALNCAVSGDDVEFAANLLGRMLRVDVQDMRFVCSGARPMQTVHLDQSTPLASLESAEHFESKSHDSGLGSWNYKTEGYAVATFADAEIVPAWPFIRTASKEILLDKSLTIKVIRNKRMPHFYVPACQRVLHPWPLESEYLDVDALSLFGKDHLSVGHFIVDLLPRLRVLADHPNLLIALNADVSEKELELLALCGISDDRLIRCDPMRRYRFRTLTVADFGSALFPSPENVKFVAHSIRETVDPDRRRSRLFIERGVKTRNIDNSDTFSETLDKFGFETICLQDMSIAQQRERIAEAEIVMAVYGSDLLAYYFMAEGSHLIELNWDENLYAAAAPSCHFLGLEYHLMLGEKASQRGAQKFRKDHDFIVDGAALNALLHDITNDH